MIPTRTPAAAHELQHSLEILQGCRDACLDAVGHCSSRGGVLADRGVIQLLQSCARLCRTSEAALSVGSGWCRDVIEACAAACVKSAGLCAGFDTDGSMQHCAERCIECASACEVVTRSMGREHGPQSRASTAA